MQQEHHFSLFTRALLAGVFAGFVGTVICLIYNVVYRGESGYTPSALINVSSLIFAVNLLFVVIGLIYFVFLRYVPQGNLLFIVLFLVLTLFCLLETSGVHRSDIAADNAHFKVLLSGVIIILGTSAAVLMPWSYNDKRFEEHVF